jgi:hypothetical protein
MTNHSSSRVKHRHVLQNRRSIVGDYHLSRSGLDLDVVSTVADEQKRDSVQRWVDKLMGHRRIALTILSMPLGPKLVRTASETASGISCYSQYQSRS